MQNYQPYLPINQGFQQMQPNPYMQRMEHLQQFQQTLQPTVPQQLQNQFPALGKIVESVDIVKTTDIPMDGNMYYFPTADGSTVFGKRWLANGQTQILAFKPILSEETTNTPTSELETLLNGKMNVLDGVLESLNNLHEKIDKISKSNTTSKAKKESVTDE